jgi:hypothetical protein
VSPSPDSCAPAPAWFELDALLGEIARYLAAVDAFREEGREPTWRTESDSLQPLAGR